MRARHLLIVFALVGFLGLSGCADMVSHGRSRDFYQKYLNVSEKAATAPQKLAELKFLETTGMYPMRVALFENGTAYYEIDRLGNGQGTWEYKDGAMRVLAQRPVFDMLMYVSAAEASGEKLVVRYYDRYGFNSADIESRNTSDTKEKVLLRPYTSSSKNI